MAILVTCACGKQLRLKDELAGKNVRCPECKQLLEVVADEPPERDEEKKDRRPPSKGKRGMEPANQSRMVLWILVGGGVAAVLLLGVVLVVVVVVFVGRNAITAANKDSTGKQKDTSDSKAKLGGGNQPAVVEVGEPKWRLKLEPQSDSFDVSPDGKWVATVGPKGLALWNMATGQKQGPFQPPNEKFSPSVKPAFRPDSKAVVGSSYGRLVSVAVPSGQVEWLPEVPGSYFVIHLGYTKDSRLLGVLGNLEKQAAVYDFTKKQMVVQSALATDDLVGAQGAMAGDGKQFIIQTLYTVWLLTPGKVTKLVDYPKDGDHLAIVRHAACAAAKPLAAIESGHLSTLKTTLYDLETQQSKGTIDFGGELVNQLALSGDGKWLAISAGGGLQDRVLSLWNVASKSKLANLKGGPDRCDRLAIAQNKSLLAGLEQSDALYVWDLAGAALDRN
jgi:hypothetical protein